jgi:hypothetical protein
MSGFLRSLASQAMGLPPRMRPITRPGFDAVEKHDARLTAETEATLPSEGRGYFPTSVSQRAQHAPKRAKPNSPPGTPLQAEPRVQGRGESRVTGEFDIPPERDSTPERERSKQYSPRSVSAKPKIAPREVHSVEPPEPPQVRARAETAPQPGAGAAAPIVEAAAVPALRPTARQGERGRDTKSGPRLGARPGLEAPMRIAAHEVSETHAPDVHIHIGRVELTAVTTNKAQARTRAPEAKRPMTLDEYLRHRKSRTP